MRRRAVKTGAGTPLNLFQCPTPDPAARNFGWSARNGNLFITRSAALHGGWGARAVATTAGQGFGVFISDNASPALYGLAVGDFISVRCDFRAPGLGFQINIRFQQGNSVLSNVTGTFVSNSGTSKVENVQIPTGCDNFFFFTNTTSTAAGQAVDIDGLMLVKAATAPTSWSAGIAVTSGTQRINTAAASSRPVVPTGALQWSPPTLTSPLVVNITNDPATRYVLLSAGQDCIVNLPNYPLTDNNAVGASVGTRDALIQIEGGRHVVLIGGHIQVPPPLTATFTRDHADNDTAFDISSTVGWPTSGQARCEGEIITYTGISGNTLTGVSRNVGFVNTGPTPFSLAHLAGATVYLAESHRSGISLKAQTGTRHIEGLRIDGYPVDCIRLLTNLSAVQTGTVQIQNCHLGGPTAFDRVYQQDGHPDGIQLIGAPHTLQLDRVTMRLRDGRGINNQGSTLASPLLQATVKNTEFVMDQPNSLAIANSGADRVATAWTFSNVWAISPGGRTTSDDSTIVAALSLSRPNGIVNEFCPSGSVGVGYTNTVGYLT